MLPRPVGIVVRVDTCRRSVSRIRFCGGRIHHCESVELPRHNHGWVGDVGSVSEVTFEPSGADETICSMGGPNVREGESLDIEIDSGAEVSCLPFEHRCRHVSTARDAAQHVWRSPRCGWWRQTA